MLKSQIHKNILLLTLHTHTLLNHLRENDLWPFNMVMSQINGQMTFTLLAILIIWNNLDLTIRRFSIWSTNSRLVQFYFWSHHKIRLHQFYITILTFLLRNASFIITLISYLKEIQDAFVCSQRLFVIIELCNRKTSL